MSGFPIQTLKARLCRVSFGKQSRLKAAKQRPSAGVVRAERPFPTALHLDFFGDCQSVLHRVPRHPHALEHMRKEQSE